MSDKLTITPDTKVSKLLDAYPELEDKLIEIAPAFKKLRNPILRKTIARVTSLKQAARVGEVPLGKVINELRSEVGQDLYEDYKEETENSKEPPAWFVESKIKESLDARPILDVGGHPLDKAVKAVKTLGEGEIYELITPFFPAPLVKTIEQMGYKSWTKKASSELYKSYFCKR